MYCVPVVRCSSLFKKRARLSSRTRAAAPPAGSNGALLCQQVQETGREEQTASVKPKTRKLTFEMSSGCSVVFMRL